MQLKNKILIAYYSMTSHTRRVAELIQNAVGGELASIRTKETYPSDYEAMVEQGRREVNEGFLPVLNEFPVDIDACHMIFLGTPVWWYSIAPAMKSFLAGYDLSGKSIAPFCTHGGSGTAQSVSDIRSVCPNSTILGSLAVYGSRAENSRGDVEKWLEQTGILKNN